MSYRRNKRIRSIVETDPSIHLHPSTWRSFVYTARETIRFERETGKRGHRDLVIFILLSKDHATIRRLTSRWRQVAFIAIDGSSSWLIHRECCWVTTEGSMYETTTEKRFCNDSGRKKKKKKIQPLRREPAMNIDEINMRNWPLVFEEIDPPLIQGSNWERTR